MAVQFQRRLRSAIIGLLDPKNILGLAPASLLILPSITLADFVGISLVTATQQPVTQQPVTQQPAKRYEAENASLSPGFQVADNHADFNGSGFVDYVGEGAVGWIVRVDEGGPFLLSFRFALRSGDRPLDILVNGSVVAPDTSFPATGAWYTWNTVETEVMLNPGVNTIHARTRGSSGPNMDTLTLSGIAPSQ